MTSSAFRTRIARFSGALVSGARISGAPIFGAMAALLSAAAFLTLTLAAPAAQAAQAQRLFDHPKYASIVVDANSGEVLFALRADAPRVPASITKVMTLYLTFEALETGRVKLSDPITVSPHAASMSPSKTALRAGEQLTVDEAIRVVSILSANDIAVALGEHLAGGEAKFAQLMTLRAQELGMTGTRFVNASGLPDVGNRQITTARDIAILSRAVMRDYPQYYAYFSQKEFNFRGRRLVNHNHLLLRMPGVDGLKTGFTNAAGYNLAASALRDGRRVITVVLGGSSTAARDENVEELLTAGFSVLSARERGQTITVASLIAAPYEAAGAVIRPSAELGSGEQGGLQLAAADPQHLPGDISSAMMGPLQVGGAIRTATHQECHQVRTTVVLRNRHGHHGKPKTVVSTQCRESSAPRSGAPMPVIAKTVVQAAPDCARLHGAARTRCHREQTAQGLKVASASKATKAAPSAKTKAALAKCDALKSPKVRASCRRIESEGEPSAHVATTKKTGAAHKVAAAAKKPAVKSPTVASAKLRGAAAGKTTAAAKAPAAKTAPAKSVAAAAHDEPKKPRRLARAD